jgi:hypothetical protein
MTMTWTTRKPDRPCSRYYRTPKGTAVRALVYEGDTPGELWAVLELEDGWSRGCPLADLSGEWNAAPIPEPADAPGGEG